MTKRNCYFKFDVKIRDYYGSNNTAIAFSRLLYWFRYKPDGFYKFKQACNKHPLYKKGDSWGEELGMSRKILDPIFNRLITHYKTKSSFSKETDRFKGKMFASYTNHKTSQTYYFMDSEAVNKFLEGLGVKSNLTPLPSSPSTKRSADSLPVTLSSDVPNEPPLACAHPKSSVLQTITSLSGGDPAPIVDAEREEEKLVSKKMVDTWNSQMQDQVVWRASYASKLCNILNQFFKGCLEAFKRYCLTVASADFLTGKAKNSKFKAFLFWAIKPEIIQDILEGAYGVKNFFTLSTPEESNLKTEIRQLNSDIEVVESKIESSKQIVVEDQKKLVEELRKSLDPDELSSLREESDKDFYEKNPQHQKVNDRFSRIMLDAHFEGRDGFLQRKLKERLGFSDQDHQPLELSEKLKSLQAMRDQKSIELNAISQQKRSLYGLKALIEQ